MRGPAGDVRWRRIVSRPRPSPDGGSLWDGLMMDVTDARLAADAAEAQRLRLETAVSATGLGLWEWDPRRNRVTWSARTCELFDVPRPGPKHIYGAVELVFPSDRQAMRDAYAAAAAAPDGGDFVVEHRTSRAPADQPRWLQTSGRVIKDADGVRQVIGASLDITDRVASEERRGLLMREIAHRAKNGIAVMMALVAQASRNAQTVAEFENVLSTRLRAMAESQDLVTAANGGAVALADVIAKTVGPFDASRFDIDASLAEVTVPGDMAIGLGLLLHELSTNAVKYGALSSVSGRVTIRRSPGAPGETRLTWAERGGPEVRPTRRRGFGSRLLEMVLRTQGGRVDPLFAPEGFRADIRFPQAAADRLH